MPKNKIDDLRNLLFETMERLMDEDNPMDIDRAEAIGKTAQVIVNSAKVEVDFMKQTGHGGSDFMQNAKGPRQLTAGPQTPAIDVTPETAKEDLCLNCTLPECDESSPHCLVQIQRRMAA